MRGLVPRLITFDVTGTLLMTRLEQHYVEAAHKFGLAGLDGPRLARTFRASFKRLESEHPVFGRHSGFGWRNWWRALVRDVFVDQHPNIPGDKLEKIADSLIKCYSTSRCWHAYPGAADLLQSLRRRDDLVLGVISNFDERLESVLRSSGLRPYFSFVITSYGLGVEKPSPAIFQEALRLCSKELGRPVRPSEAVHVGDRVDNDYMGARSASWNALLVKHDGLASIIDPAHVFSGLPQLKTHFDQVLRPHEHEVAS